LAEFVAGLAVAHAAGADRRRELRASSEKLGKLAEQQAALRRVATLVARGVDPSELFNAVADEIAEYLHVDSAALMRYSPDQTAIIVSGRNAPFLKRAPLGERYPLQGHNVPERVLATGRPARMDSHDNAAGTHAARAREWGIRGAVGVPIVADGRIWGLAVVASTKPVPLPADTEERLGDFAELVATAIADAAARDELRDLAEQQAALRRVATLVARGVEPGELFKAVADEIADYLHVDSAALMRYSPDWAEVIVCGRNTRFAKRSPPDERYPLDGIYIPTQVLATGCAVRLDTLDSATDANAARVREWGIRGAVGVPIVVNDSVWGLAVVGSTKPEPLPADTEERLGDFADLVATAIANAATHDELIASRARIVAAADDARRRLERDLHDGAQQRLVSLGLQLRQAQASVQPEHQDLKEQLSRIVSNLNAVSSELQQISRGIHPPILSEGGLGPALKTLARRCPVPVDLDVGVERRLPDPVEVAAYYVVAEALTNAAKYAQASEVNVRAETNGANLYLSIRDDGIGGADARNGSGLIGLKDRIEALGGHLQITSPPGSGTSLHITIPVKAHGNLRPL
jgi:signal transduction histidine kinase